MSDKQKPEGSEAQEPDLLHLHADPTGRGTAATVTARRGGADGEVVACEKFDLAKSKERQKFIEDLRERLGDDAYHLLDAEAVERDLAAMAADLAAPPKAAPLAEAVEIGDGRVVRPERFILRDVSGLAVPRRTARGSEVVSEWMLYLRWRDGRREAIPLPEMLSVEGERVFFDTRPPELRAEGLGSAAQTPPRRMKCVGCSSRALPSISTFRARLPRVRSRCWHAGRY